MEVQLSPLSPRAGPRFANVSDFDTTMNIDSPIVLSKPKSVRFASDNPMSLEYRLVSALESLAASSRKQNELLEHRKKAYSCQRKHI